MLPFEENQDHEQAIEAIFQGKSVSLAYPAILDSEIASLSSFLYRLLARLDLAYLSEMLLVLLREIASNCSKANAKRIYFRARNIDINDPDAYRVHMNRFAEEVLGEWEDFSTRYDCSGFHVRISIRLDDDAIHLEAESNSQLRPEEKERIALRFAKFRQYDSLENAFSELWDSTEGAGLGIVMTLFLLRNSGADPDSFRIEPSPNGTISRVSLPRILDPRADRKIIRQAIINESEELPSFPEHIASLVEMCTSETIAVQTIAEKIQRDPGLTAQVLRLVNSAGYMIRNRNPSLTDAVKIIGLKSLRNLLMVSGARGSFEERYPRMKDLERVWENSNRVSFIARNLLRADLQWAETAAVAGLLHEMGKIVLISLKPEIIRKFQELAGTGHIRNTAVIEEVALGIGHPELGAGIAKRWNFPEALVVAILYQQRPFAAPEKYETLIRAIYLAVRIQDVMQGRSNYYSVEPEILDQFGLKDETIFRKMVLNLKNEYEKASP